MLRREPQKELTEEEIQARKLRKMNKEFFKLLDRSDKPSELHSTGLRQIRQEISPDKARSGTLDNSSTAIRSQTEEQAAKIREKNRREEEELRTANLERLRQENELKRRMLLKSDEEFMAAMKPKALKGPSNSKERSTRESIPSNPSQKPKPKPKDGQPPDHFNFSLITSNSVPEKQSHSHVQQRVVNRASPSGYNPLDSQLGRSEALTTPKPLAARNPVPVSRSHETHSHSKGSLGYNPLDSQLRAPSQTKRYDQFEYPPRSGLQEISAVTNPPRHMIQDLAMIKRKIDQKRREEAQRFGLPPPPEAESSIPGRGDSRHKQTNSAAKEPKRKKIDIQNDPDYFYCFRCQEHHHKNKHQIGLGLSAVVPPPARSLNPAVPPRQMAGVVPTSDPRAHHRQELEQKRQLEAALGKRHTERDPPPRVKPSQIGRDKPRREYENQHDYIRDIRYQEARPPRPQERPEHRRPQRTPEQSYEDPEEDEQDDESDLSGFIDNDDPVEYDTRHIKKEIHSALRYDAERYRRNDTAIDDREMEVRNYAAIEREEKYSRRIGRMEDQLEEERNNRLSRKPAHNHRH